MRLNSLAFRLFATAAAWTVLVLPLAGLIIYSLYAQEVQANFDERLRQLLTVVHADTIDHAGTEPGTPGQLGEPLFLIPGSGWYWQIKPLDGVAGKMQTSPSLVDFFLPSPFEAGIAPDNQGNRWLDTKGPHGQRLRIAEIVYAFGDEFTGPRYSVAIAAPLDWLDARLSSFARLLTGALAIAGLGLVVVTFFQVRFGLSPLRAIEKGLSAIRSGEAKRLDGQLPVEIEPLQVQLNALIQSNEAIIERARTQVGNLAHALKTPLAVIVNEAAEAKDPFAQKVADQARIMRDQVNHYLDRARVAARVSSVVGVTEVKPVAEALKRTLERIHSVRDLAIAIDCPTQCRFQGERQDLEEMLGNLLDNACKWATSKVLLAVVVPPSESRGSGARLQIRIDDDGPGLTEEQRKTIGKRGMRLDETKPGSGLGLSIVADLAQSYRGSLRLDRSPLGGLSAQLELPAA
jgi:signal transduction histidine kinase